MKICVIYSCIGILTFWLCFALMLISKLNNADKKFIDKKILVIVENFFLSSKQLLTNPLATPKIIGALMVLVEDIMNWDYLENHPNKVNDSQITNLVNRNFNNRIKNEVIISDLTYVQVNGKWR